MRQVTRFPIRLKILITLLFVVTMVVGVITFTMASMFHQDKKTYINDLGAMVAMNKAEECRSLLVGYGERLQIYARLIGNDSLPTEDKTQLLEGLFDDFPELVAVTVYDGVEVKRAAIDTAELESAGLSADDLRQDLEEHPLPLPRILAGETYVRNATLSERLPSMRMAVATRVDDGATPSVVSAVIRLDAMLRLAAKASGFAVSIADADGILIAHEDPARVSARQPASFVGQIPSMEDQHSMGLTVEFVRDGVEMIGGFAGVDVGGVTAGAQIPKSVAHLASRDLLGRLMLVALALLVAATAVGLFWASRITRPVERLTKAARKIGQGRLDVQVEVEARDEIGELADSFNRMASELQEKQAQLIQSEKMAAFGQLGAAIAHEVKNPLTGILGGAQLALRNTDRESPHARDGRRVGRDPDRGQWTRNTRGDPRPPLRALLQYQTQRPGYRAGPFGKLRHREGFRRADRGRKCSRGGRDLCRHAPGRGAA